jgi:type IV secretion system protein VirB4
MFDKDRGAEIFLRAMGGHYARLSPGEPTGFNPLKLPDTAPNRAFCGLGRRPAAGDGRRSSADRGGGGRLLRHDAGFRRLRYFGELLAARAGPSPGDLVSRLQPWIGAGEHAWLFDNADDRLDLEQHVLGFDMTALLDTPTLRTPP